MYKNYEASAPPAYDNEIYVYTKEEKIDSHLDSVNNKINIKSNTFYNQEKKNKQDKKKSKENCDWHIVNYKEIEREQILHIKNLVEQTLYSEFNLHFGENNKKELDIIKNLNINLHYRTIEISIKKDNSQNLHFSDKIKLISKKLSNNIFKLCAEIAILHPIKTLGMLTVILKLL